MALESRLDEDGYAVIRLLDDHGCDAVRSLRSELGPAPGDRNEGLFNDSWSTDRSYTRRLSRGLGAIFAEPVQQRFIGHRPLIWGTSIKWPGPAGTVPAHRDPTFLDERRFRSVGLWCAIEPIGEDSGMLEVLPASHRPTEEVRIHQSPRNLCPDLPDNVQRRFRPVALEPGQAIVYDHSLIHRSGPNRSDRPRAVVMSHLVPADATPWYAVTTGPGQASVLEVDEEFFLGSKVDELDVAAAVAARSLVCTVADPGSAQASSDPRHEHVSPELAPPARQRRRWPLRRR